jgi:hypothetical protein
MNTRGSFVDLLNVHGYTAKASIARSRTLVERQQAEFSIAFCM